MLATRLAEASSWQAALKQDERVGPDPRLLEDPRLENSSPETTPEAYRHTTTASLAAPYHGVPTGLVVA
jgi:hypothetical protein